MDPFRGKPDVRKEARRVALRDSLRELRRQVLKPSADRLLFSRGTPSSSRGYCLGATLGGEAKQDEGKAKPVKGPEGDAKPK